MKAIVTIVILTVLALVLWGTCLLTSPLHEPGTCGADIETTNDLIQTEGRESTATTSGESG